MIERLCQQCSKTFLAKESRVRLGHAKFCSQKCFYQSISCKVEVKCQFCDKNFLTTPHRLKSGRAKFCSLVCRANGRRGSTASNETKQKMSLSHKGKCLSINAKGKISKALKGKTHSIEHRQKLSNALQGHHIPVEVRAKMSQTHKQIRSDTEFKQGQHPSPKTEFKKGQHPSPPTEVKKGQRISPETEFTSEQVKARWQDPKFVAKVFESLNKKPNKPELKLMDLLSKYLPQFEYNGDFSLGITLGGMIPDFVNANGRKEIIEVFGDYWHGKGAKKWQQTELGRVMAYNSLGYRCLVIWEHELKELAEEEIADKIKTFFKRKRLTTYMIQ